MVLVSGTSHLQHPFRLRPASPNKASMYYMIQKLIAKHSVKQTPGAKSSLSAGLQVVCQHKCFSFRQEKIISWSSWYCPVPENHSKGTLPAKRSISAVRYHNFTEQHIQRELNIIGGENKQDFVRYSQLKTIPEPGTL